MCETHRRGLGFENEVNTTVGIFTSECELLTMTAPKIGSSLDLPEASAVHQHPRLDDGYKYQMSNILQREFLSTAVCVFFTLN